MLCLGLEGTAHTLGVGLVTDGGEILANRGEMYRPARGGIHPRKAANHHADHLQALLQTALQDAGVGLEEVGLVAFSQGPGLGPCLRTVATAARALSLGLGTPVVGVNHCIAHLEVGRLVTGSRDPVLLYLSGGNTQVISYAHARYRVFGETLDIGLGNMLDKFGREAGMPFPSGPRVEELARQGSRLLPLPYTVKGMDVAFSGLLTAAFQLRAQGEALEDISHSLQEVSFAMVTEVAERAMAHLDKDELLLGGGVACNERLREMADRMTQEREGAAYAPPPALCVDNGAMIAWTGLLMHGSGVRMDLAETAVSQNLRTDAAEVPWLAGNAAA